MKKRGFTLIELMIAIFLFSILSVAAYSIMKSSMDATLAGKVQQDIQNKALTAMNAITTDLKSSITLRTDAYTSSVIYPDTLHFSSATQNPANANTNRWTTASFPGTAPDLTDNNGRAQLLENNNSLIFYTRDAGNDFRVVEYMVAATVAGQKRTCRLDRITWRWGNPNQLLGLDADGSDFVFSRNGTNGLTSGGGIENRQTIVEMPNNGDAIVLYTSRGVEENPVVAGQRLLIPNQYFVKIIICQNIRNIDSATAAQRLNSIYNNNTTDGSALTYGSGLTSVFAGPVNRERRNYRTTELETAIVVPKK